MLIDAVRDTLRVRMGATFGAPDVTRVEEAVEALGPFSHLTIDFAAVRQCDDASLARLVRSLLPSARGALTLRGLTLHQWRLLARLGIDLEPSAALRA